MISASSRSSGMETTFNDTKVICCQLDLENHVNIRIIFMYYVYFSENHTMQSTCNVSVMLDLHI
jgi:hypothetical protein